MNKTDFHLMSDEDNPVEITDFSQYVTAKYKQGLGEEIRLRKKGDKAADRYVLI